MERWSKRTSAMEFLFLDIILTERNFSRVLWKDVAACAERGFYLF